MKVRDTALSNEGRIAAGRWLKALREACGLSQSDLAAYLDEPHYSFVSQLETGRRSIPTFYIDRLARALNVHRGEFARQLLQHQDPFMHSALFGSEEELAALVEAALIEREPESFSLEAPIIDALLRSGQTGSSLAELQREIERAVGRELHYQSISQTLRRLEKAGRVRRDDGRWIVNSRPAPVSNGRRNRA